MKKIVTVIILVVIAGVGLAGIGLLSGKVSLPEKKLDITGEEPVLVKEEEQVIKKLINFEPENMVTIGKIEPGSRIVIGKVKLEETGFVVVYANNSAEPASVLGFSKKLEKGETADVTVNLREKINDTDTVYIGLRLDDGDGFFEISGMYDKNISRADGTPILEEFKVSK